MAQQNKKLDRLKVKVEKELAKLKKKAKAAN
jgi:hypothetical protein